MSSGPQQGDLFDRDIPPWEIDADCQCWAASIVFSEPPHGPFSYRIDPPIQDVLKPGMSPWEGSPGYVLPGDEKKTG